MTETTTTSNIENWIWFYYDVCGFSIIPLGVNKEKKDSEKKPSIPTWAKYHETRATREEIQQWIDQGLFKNIAVICGSISNDLVILDIDNETLPEVLKLQTDKIYASGSWYARTGKGFQIWCKHHGNPGGIQKPPKYKIEYRANNGYCVVPPSIHPNGNTYHFKGKQTFNDLQPLIAKDVKSIFEDFKKKIGIAWNIEPPSPKTMRYIGNTTEELNGFPRCVETALNTKQEPGGRYYKMYAIISSCFFRGLPKEETLRLATDFNKNMCTPPHDAEIVNQAVEGAYKDDAHHYGCEYWIDDAELCPYDNIFECPHGKKKAKRELIKKYHIFSYKEETNKKTGEKYQIVDKVHPVKTARLLLNEFDLHFKTLRDTKEIAYFDNGMYHFLGETKIAELSQFFLEDNTKIHHINEITSYITNNNYVERKNFEIPPHLINLENGVYNLETNSLEPHNPKYCFINRIPIQYDAAAKCPKIQKFFTEVLYESDIPALQEFFGYCLYRRYLIHKAVMFLGSGKNGKSTVIRLLRLFLGEENTSNKELYQLIEDKFSTAALYGKLLNSASDISNKALMQTGRFKELTGEDPVDAEVKFKSSFTFINYAKLLFSANQLPKTNDESYAFFRRWLLISFPNTFEGKNCNKKMLEEIATPEELSGLLNWAIEGLQRLLQQGDFTYSKSVEDIAQQYKTLSDPIYAYVDEHLVCKTGGGILKDEVYQHYVEWCKKQQLPVNPKNTFTSELSKHLHEIRPGRLGGKGCQKPAYLNIAWKTTGVQQEDTSNYEGQTTIDNPATNFTGGII